MDTKPPSAVLHDSGRYVVCLVKPGLTVQTKRKGTGVLLPRSHAQFSDYLSAFSEQLDANEGDALCRALLTV